MASRVLVSARLLGVVAGCAWGAAALGQSAPVENAPVTDAAAARAGREAAQEAGAPASQGWAYEVDNRYHVRVEPGAWYVAPSGDIQLPSDDPDAVTDEVDVEDLAFDNARFTPFAEVHISRGRWRGTFRGFYYGADRTSQAEAGFQIGDLGVSALDTVRSSLDMASYELEAAYTWRDFPRDSGTSKSRNARFKADVFGGVRFYDVDFSIADLTPTPSGPAPSDSADEFFVEPQVGAKFTLQLYEKATIDLQGGVGGLPLGDQSSMSVDIIAGFSYMPIEHVGLQIGYRALFFGLESGEGGEEFKFDGALQGLYFGAVIEF